MQIADIGDVAPPREQRFEQSLFKLSVVGVFKEVFVLRWVAEPVVEPAFAFVEVPHKYSPRGLRVDRSPPFLVRATANIALPAGEHLLLLRARSAARITFDEKVVAQTPFLKQSKDGHGHVENAAKVFKAGLRPLQTGDREELAVIESPGAVHQFRVEWIVGGGKLRPELGEAFVAIRSGDSGFHLLSPSPSIPLTDDAWLGYIDARRLALSQRNQHRRHEATEQERAYWEYRHRLAREQLAEKSPATVPKSVDENAEQNDIDRFINSRLHKAGLSPAPSTDDWSFLRRVSLDIIGTLPSQQVIESFLADEQPGRRERLIDRLLEHSGWADNWVGYWQDVLAENPGIIKPTLNNTGPFRWWIHESFADNKPFDQFATELVMMEGSQYFGGPAGFSMATQNDAPMAAKAHVIGQAFLALEMKCARCHDAPTHKFVQQDLFSLASMLKREPQAVPKSSTIPLAGDEVASLSVTVSLKPGQEIEPAWPFPHLTTNKLPAGMLRNPEDSRERLAALITSPANTRFARVIVNRLWQRYLGRGLVEPVDDWENAEPSHPALLDYLSRELVTHGYDLKHVARLILNSHTYQRAITRHTPESQPPSEHSNDGSDLFATPLRRRMSAEQIVDSLFAVTGKRFNAGQLNSDLDGSRPYTSFINLGTPRRAWQFTSLSNERDRPSLSLPRAQGFVSLLETFGWRSSRQSPLSIRDREPTVLQPAILANGIVGRRFTQLSDDNLLTGIALESQPLDRLIHRVFERVLTRAPTDDELRMFQELLKDGYDSRRIAVAAGASRVHRIVPTGVSWSNHLSPEANRLQVELQRLVEQGDPPTQQLQPEWRERMEDMLWALVNSPEFVFLP